MSNTVIANAVIVFFKRVRSFPYIRKNYIGRWNTKDNSDIKATLANMDCCGDSLCGNPANYSKNIEQILKEGKTKIDL